MKVGIIMPCKPSRFLAMINSPQLVVLAPRYWAPTNAFGLHTVALSRLLVSGKFANASLQDLRNWAGSGARRWSGDSRQSRTEAHHNVNAKD
ncbi:uncharacterized protein CLUP02_09676 [Colletotrichum lupini]|uniref:Uncharacterized protein n=1 Tax=Colletotrichum lupini TaxID=145971 RepID=A0A9Q8SVG3_9PEZI|nr:uncharacterized protein CLUP02_09676 [Colletotrichum lupini]UQC84180.1 hypothetical protein CLUP02_09676 [Colletotrichum lupini]